MPFVADVDIEGLFVLQNVSNGTLYGNKPHQASLYFKRISAMRALSQIQGKDDFTVCELSYEGLVCKPFELRYELDKKFWDNVYAKYPIEEINE